MNYRQKQAAYKLAQARMAINYVARQRALQKRAGIGNIVGTMARNLPGEVLASPFVGGLPDVGTSVSAATDDSKDPESVIQGRENIGVDFLPGGASYHLTRPRRVLENILKENDTGNKTLSERFGTHTSALTTIGLPTALGGVLGGPFGAGLGFMGGLGATAIGNTVGTLGALFNKGRTTEDLKKYYNDRSAWKNWLIPGYAEYNGWKNLAAAERYFDEYADKKDKKSKDNK